MYDMADPRNSPVTQNLRMIEEEASSSIKIIDEAITPPPAGGTCETKRAYLRRVRRLVGTTPTPPVRTERSGGDAAAASRDPVERGVDGRSGQKWTDYIKNQ